MFKSKKEKICKKQDTKIATDIRMRISDKDEISNFIRESVGKWIYIKFNYQNRQCVNGVYTKLKVKSIEERRDTLYIYGDEDRDRLTISWLEVVQYEITPNEDEVLIEMPQVDINIKQYQPLINQINSLPNIDEHMIMTEGKTDWKILKAALDYFKSIGEYSELDISFLENDGQIEVGNNTLQRIRNYNAIFPNNKLRIFIFDPDVKEINEEHKDCEGGYKFWENNVYSFTLPIPEFRKDTPLISIENYFSDEDIKTQDRQGRRLYLVGEFDKTTGRHKTLKNVITLASLSGDSNHIIDNKVYYVEDLSITKENVYKYEQKRNIALSKNDFAENIFNKNEKFANINFNNFRLIFDCVERIFKEYNMKTDMGEEISPGVYLEKSKDGFENMLIYISIESDEVNNLKKNGIITKEIQCLDKEFKIELGIEKRGGEFLRGVILIKYTNKLKEFLIKKIKNSYNRIYLLIFDKNRKLVKTCELFSGENGEIIFENLIKSM